MAAFGRIERFLSGIGIFNGTGIFNLSLTDEKAWDRTLWNLRGSQSLSGETVTEDTALTYSAVFNAITLIAGTTGSLPLHLKRKQDRKTVNVTEKPLYSVMHDQWNPYMSAMAGRECMSAHILGWGNGYAEIVRNGYGEIVQLWPITPNRVTPKIENSKLVYDIKFENEDDITLPREKVLHIPGLGFDGLVGYSVIAMARKSIGLGMAMETFGSYFFSQGTHPGVVVTHPGKLSSQAHDNLETSLKDAHSGLGQSHRLLLLEEAMEVKNIGINPQDSQFLESRVFHILEIARWFNIPPHKLKELSKSSFNNIESEQAAGFVTDTLLPWLIRFEQNYRMQLLSPREIKEGLYFKHNMDGLLRGNAKDRAEYYKIMWLYGFLTQNEIRELEDKDPNPNPLADELFIMGNMVPLSKYEEHIEKQGARQTPGAEPKEIEPKDRLKLLESK